MFKNKNPDGTLNVCGKKILELRKAHKDRLSQKDLSDKLLLLYDLDLNKNAIQQIESGQRFVTDIELKVFAQFFGVTTDHLLD